MSIESEQVPLRATDFALEKTDQIEPKNKYRLGTVVFLSSLRSYELELKKRFHEILAGSEDARKHLQSQTKKYMRMALVGISLSIPFGTVAYAQDIQDIDSSQITDFTKTVVESPPPREEVEILQEQREMYRERQSIIEYNRNQRTEWGPQPTGTRRTISRFIGQTYLNMHGLEGKLRIEDLYRIEDERDVDTAHLLWIAQSETQLGNDVKISNRDGEVEKYNIGNVKLLPEEQSSGKVWASPQSYQEGFDLIAQKFDKYRDQDNVGDFYRALRTGYSNDAKASNMRKRIARHDRIVNGLRYLSLLHSDKLITDAQAKKAVMLLDNRSLGLQEIYRVTGIPQPEEMQLIEGYEQFINN